MRERFVTYITINRPQARNALTSEMQQALGEAFDEFSAETNQRVAVVTGAGNIAFCAGSDLKSTLGDNVHRTYSWPGGYGGLTNRFDLVKPVIAAVNGFAMGGGFEIALACDIVVASDTAVFGLPEPAMGVAATAGGLLRLPRQIGYQRAMGLILTGRRVSAAEGERLGFVNEVVPARDLMVAVARWADSIVKNSPVAVRASKDAVSRGLAAPNLETAIAEQHGYPGLNELWESEDFREGPRAFVEKRPPRWRT
jgi:enoyl-CoA hydratase/carnithine racemase